MSVEIDYSAVRKIPPKTQGNRGFFPSRKVLNGVAEYESQIERDFFLLLHHDPSVKLFQHQPTTIIYEDLKGKKRRYIPDVYIEFNNGLRMLIEIKDSVEIEKNYQKFQERWKNCKEQAERKGILFSVITDAEIRTPRLANIWFTLGSSKCRNLDSYIAKLGFLIPQKGIQYYDLCSNLAEYLGIEITSASQIICYAIYHGLVFVDSFTTRNIVNSTIIRKKNPSIDSLPFLPLWEEWNWDISFSEHFFQNKFRNKNSSNIKKPLKSLSTYFIPEKYKDEVEFRLKVVEEWNSQPSRKRTEEWRTKFVEKIEMNQKRVIGVSTIYRWVSNYKIAGIEGLFPWFTKSGKKNSISKTHSDIFEEARKEFLTPEGTLKKAYRYLIQNWPLSIEIPSKSTLYRYIISSTSSSDLIFNRKGRRYHKSDFTASLGSFQGAIMPMQVLQFDNTSFDVFPVDSENRLPLGTPYLTAAIDCYTRMIVGFHLSLYPASSQSVLETLVQSILPKDLYSNLYNTESKWMIEGFPVLLLVDNGMDYRSNSVRDFCLKYDIILEFAPIRTPRYKAYIEKWFDTLHRALVDENVPGCRPELKERLDNPDLQPEENAIITTQELESWLTQWVVDQYHFTNPYNDNVPAPIFRFLESVDGKTDPILPKPRNPPKKRWEIDLLQLNAFEKQERVLKNYGIQYINLKYNNQELVTLFKEIGPNNKIKILIDRKDIRQIWVENPNTGKPFSVDLASGWAKIFLELFGDLPISESAWKKQLRIFREKNRNKITPYLLKMEYSRSQRIQIIDSAKNETKKVRREKERRKETLQRRKNISLYVPKLKKKKSKNINSLKRKIDLLPDIDAYPTEKRKN